MGRSHLPCSPPPGGAPMSGSVPKFGLGPAGGRASELSSLPCESEPISSALCSCPLLPMRTQQGGALQGWDWECKPTGSASNLKGFLFLV